MDFLKISQADTIKMAQKKHGRSWGYDLGKMMRFQPSTEQDENDETKKTTLPFEESKR